MRLSEISVVIPTKDRPDELRRCLASILAQKEAYPEEVIIVDSGDEKRELDISPFKKSAFPIFRVKSEPGLTRQRNIGIERAKGEIIAFLDDDSVVTDDYFESLEASYNLVPDASGIQGTIINSPKRTLLNKFFARIFFLAETNGDGKVKRSGTPSFLDNDTCVRKNRPCRTDIFCGVASYRRRVFEAGFRFNELLQGYCLGEDYEFSYKVSRRFPLYTAPAVRSYHLPSTAGRDPAAYYYQRIANVYLYYKEFEFDASLINRLAFFLYVLGTMFQAARDSLMNRCLSGLSGWWRGLSEIAGKVGSQREGGVSTKVGLIGVMAVALLCGAAILLNTWMPLILILLIWLVWYLSRSGFIKGILLLLIIYMPFDSFILSHMQPSLFLYMKYLSTGTILLISMIMILRSYNRPDIFMKVPGLLFLLLYIISGFISAIINNVDPAVTFTALQQELRYIPLFIGLGVTYLDERYIKKAVKVILIVGFVNVLVGIVQLCGGKFITPLLLQKAVIVESELISLGTAQVIQKAGLIFGVFPSYNVFGAYLTIIFLLLAGFNRYKIFNSSVLRKAEILVFITLLFTLSRSSIMGATIGYLIILFASKSKKSIPIVLLFVGTVIFIFLIGFEMKIYAPNPQELPFIPRILEAFSPEGWRSSAMYGRTALMDLTMKALTDSGSFFFGLGPGNWGGLLAWKYSAFYNSILGSSQASVLDKTILADVNWASILGQFGIIGTSFFVLFVLSVARYSLRIVRISKAADPVFRSLALAALGVIAAISLESFFGSWFVSRSIAFYLWILAGFMVSLGNCKKVTKII